ncbi:uncharacterized protein KY384_004432 [Bacidia gigantensis]|uniref:uncharacterized protein n=1 Tax=Bacidia gigantensis TaxID=2732470 RepID=UPI001D03F439|nr:uncharacterized protein KY384_004432 [Bacidia gigantensis]KAG8531075.1 hypothetical protein KY384_004432 [Bacidia gigantensis]
MSPPPTPKSQRPFLIALSGPTSAGKTTIATLLTSIFSSDPSPSPTPTDFGFTLLHADDFYKPDSQIPTHPTGVQDWDCAEALDVHKFRDVLLDLKAGGEVPKGILSQGGLEDGVHGSAKGADSRREFVERMRGEVSAWPSQLLKGRRVVLLEGFLLFGHSIKDDIGVLFDLKILLRARREKAKERREGRNGYVTLEGFWQDPEGYFDDVVWPNYVREHAWLFEGGDVEGSVSAGVVKGCGAGEEVEVGPAGEEEVEEVCEWVIGCMRAGLEMKVKS